MLFKNILLAVDVDGTLYNDDCEIPQRNITAIKEFCENGGLFTLATGRATSYARYIASQLDISIPCVVYNGSMVYDYKNEKIIWQKVMPGSVIDSMKDFQGKFPTIGIEIMQGEDIYVISTNFQTEAHITSIHVPVIRCSLDEAPSSDLDKILIVDEEDAIDELFAYAVKLGLDDTHVTRSSPFYLEMLPPSTNKSEGLKELIKICNLDNHYLVTAGDFINDLEMLKMSDLPVAVGNALDIVKEHADLVVCDNNSGAIYEVIEYLKVKNNI